MQESLDLQKPSYIAGLEELSGKWEETEMKQRLNEIISLLKGALSANVSKNEFIAATASLFDISGQTVIKIWVESYLTHGDKCIPDMCRDTTATQSADAATATSSVKDTVNPENMPDALERTRVSLQGVLDETPGRKKKTGRKSTTPSEITSIKSLLALKKNVPLYDKDFVFIYKRLESEWPNLTQGERALLVRGIIRYEAESNTISYEAMGCASERLPFLSIEQIAGYVEINANRDTLMIWANKDLIDDDGVRLIGEIRLKLGSIISSFSGKLRQYAKDKANNMANGKYKNDIFSTILKESESSKETAAELVIGEEYIIDEDTPQSAAYQGYIGDTFTFIDQTNPDLDPYLELKKNAFQVFFVGRGGKIFVIDWRAVKSAPKKI